ncbi:MAG: DUF1501 domain-containing protein [Beijerinckiaceae bacterium]|jgi:uncharacterized protein (DUF1501 family)|nr:DUF1501 domain-containing protein [Beijerinckiaceae bacterium]
MSLLLNDERLFDRRRFLQGAGVVTLAALTHSHAAFARTPGDNRLVFVILRGALDGLHALPPHADAAYRALRPQIALGKPGSENGALDLNGYFGLHPALAPLKGLFAASELLAIPAAATRYRQRSHFDAQNMLENGSGKPFGARDGWLNRAIVGLNAGDRRLGLSLGPSLPLLMQGPAHVQTWAPSSLPKADGDFLHQLAQVYAADPLFASALADATGAMKPKLEDKMMRGRTPRNQQFSIAAKAAAQLLAREDGPRIAVMDMQGWDTHFAQERRLSALFKQLSEGIMDLKSGLGATWSKTAVIVVSEFGRTAAENGNRGTDHGTGGLALLAGGAVRGGRIGGHWPGLSEKALFEGRDVRPANDFEGIFKAAMIRHLGLREGFVEDTVFPGSRGAKMMEGVFV